MARRPTRYRRRRPRRPPAETPLPTIPSQPQQPKQGVPVPSPAPPPVPVVGTSESELERRRKDITTRYQESVPLSTRLRRNLVPFGQNIWEGLDLGGFQNILGGFLRSFGEPTQAFPPFGVTRERYLSNATSFGEGPSRFALGAPEVITQADLPAPQFGLSRFGKGGRNIFGPQEGWKRSYRSTASFLGRGIRPPFIGFGAQEFLHITEDEMVNSLGYAQVPGGWVRRELLDQPLQNVYGSGTAAQSQTVNVNYGGYGGGGGGTRRQSSHLVNWRI